MGLVNCHTCAEDPEDCKIYLQGHVDKNDNTCAGWHAPRVALSCTADPAPDGRGRCLHEAYQMINGARQDTYGNPEDSFTIIGAFWDIFLKHRKPGPLKPREVMEMMSLFKHGRMLGQKTKKDNYVDAAGYLGLAADEAEKEDE